VTISAIDRRLQAIHMAAAPPRDSSPASPVISDSERLAPYVPRIAIEWLRETPDARHKQIEGSLAFVDISGFTSLTERLSRKGKVGAEEMNDLLDGCFTELLSVAYDQGAAVIKWGGDAVLLLFDGDEHEARACRGAVDMQRTMRSVGKLRTSSGLVTLRMSVGIHTGAFDFFLVGDLHRELVITGPGASTTVDMETVAEAGEVAISPATAAALDPRCLGEEKGPAILLRRSPKVSSERSSPVGDVSDLDIGRLLPIDIREHLLAGGGEAEHRPMTPAFIHFMGADELLATQGSEVLADALELVLGTVQRAAYEHQVAFFETDIASNGGKIMLMAGAPRSAGNDEERMLRAMYTVMELASPLPLRIGVNWGRIFVGLFGPPYRRTYSVKGDAVNLAARLMAKAEPGQILATDDVLKRSRTVFDVVAIEPFQAKGKAELVEAYTVVAPLGVRERGAGAPLVGREVEMSVLSEALDAARRFEGRIVELVAEPGVGKSRLTEELQARAGEARVLGVECQEYESSTPYFAFRTIFREVLASEDEEHDELERRLRERVETTAPHLVPWLPLLGVVLGLEIPDTEETAALGDEFRKTRLQEASNELLGMVLLEPTLILFEDAHWMDDASADLLRHLTDGVENRPWLIVATRRDQPSGFAAPQESNPVVIELEPLAPEQAAALVVAATEELPLLPHEIEALTERAGGNPLFLNELLTAARGGAAVEELPDSVETLMMARIDRLSPADRRVLRCAAVLGASFTKDLVAAALSPDAPGPDTWERLGDFLVDEGGGHLRFRHALVRDAAYEGLPYRRRREVHGRAGEKIEAATDRPEEEAELLSLHFFHAHDFDKAWRYSGLAGNHAQSIYANVEAERFFERALEAARHTRSVEVHEVTKVLESLGDVRVRLGDFGTAEAAYRKSLRRIEADPVEKARVMLKEALVPYWLGEYRRALRWLRRGLQLLEECEESEAAAERARFAAWYGLVRYKQGRPLEAIEWCRQAVDGASSVDSKDALAQAYVVLDWAYASLGRYDEAVYSRPAIAIYEELGDVRRRGLVLNNLGVVAHVRGRWDEALQLYEEAREAFEQVGDRWFAALAVSNRGAIFRDRGELDEAEPLFRSALRVAKAARSGSRVADTAQELGSMLARAGRFEEARALLSEAREEYERAGDDGEVLLTDARLAECLVLEGEAEAAGGLSSTALRRAEALGGDVFGSKAVLYRAHGCALMQQGRLEEARAALELSLGDARQRGADYDIALALDALVALGRLTDEPTKAIQEERDGIFERLNVVRTPTIPLTQADLAAR
jgi:class 3 adenylate cyclase/tetratricopeptide (TPR) repeat protein